MFEKKLGQLQLCVSIHDYFTDMRMFKVLFAAATISFFAFKILGKRSLSPYAISLTSFSMVRVDPLRMYGHYDEYVENMDLLEFEEQVLDVMHQLHVSKLIIKKYDEDHKDRINSLKIKANR